VLPAIPTPGRLAPAKVRAIAEAVIAWAPQAPNLETAREAQARVAALEAYLERRQQNTQRMRWAARQLEKRIGKLLGPATVGRPADGNVTHAEHFARRADPAECRLMLRFRRVWDDYALWDDTQSDTIDPCSRRAVLHMIAEHRADAGRRARILDADERQIDVPEDLDPITGDGWTVIPGDFRDVMPKLPPASVDLIVTDPPYSEEALDVWTDLSRLAAKLLMPQGILVALTGTILLPAVLERMRIALQYGWVYAQPLPGLHSRILARHVTQAWKPWLAFSNGPWPSGRVDWHDDLLPISARDKRHSTWQQQLRPAQYLIERLSPTNGVVCDPMLGTGTYAAAARTAGRAVIGIEADQVRLDAAVARLKGVRS
jgi:DNA methylase